MATQQKSQPMTLEELKKKKMYLNVFDIMQVFGCSRPKAYNILDSVKYCTGNMLGISGKILVTELEAWMNAVQIKI